MSLTLRLANLFAMLSCSNWNKIPLFRVIFRKLYQHMGERSCKLEDYRNAVELYKSGQFFINTYVPLYASYGFANWEEHSDPKHCTIVRDQSGCIIKHSASYCAHMIHMTTGKWLKDIPTNSTTISDWLAKDWYNYLPKVGYKNFISFLEPGRHYIGIGDSNEEFGRQGIVVWFEKIDYDNRRAIVSSYQNYGYWIGSVKPEEFVWIQID